MKKLLFCLLALFILSFLSPVLAQSASDGADGLIPEKDGIYNVSGRPDLKVRVFVHHPKAKPSPTPQPSLICNQADPDSLAVIPAAGWKLPSNWNYQLNLSSVPASVGSSNLTAFAQTAFSAWSTASGNKVTFVRGDNTSTNRKGLDGKNIVAWGRTSGSALAVTYTWYYTATNVVAEVDTIMNVKFPWSWSGNNDGCAVSNSYDAQNILTHELGHWMGLDDVYDVSYGENTMFGYGSKGEIKKDTLTTGDVVGVLAIYP